MHFYNYNTKKESKLKTSRYETKNWKLNHLLQQMNQSDTLLQDDDFTPQKIENIPTSLKRVPPQHGGKNEFSLLTPFVIQVITERKERLLRMLSALLKIF